MAEYSLSVDDVYNYRVPGKVEMSLIDSFVGDYRRWSRIEQIVSQAFLIAALGGVASMFTPLLGG